MAEKELQFLDKYHLLRYIAGKYVNKAHYDKYDIDELVNEAWLCPNVRKQEHAMRFCMAVHWAMINYMRLMEDKNKKKWKIKFSSFADFEHSGEPNYLFESLTLAEISTDMADLELKDALPVLLQSLTPFEIQLLIAKLNGVQQTELALKLHFSKQTIWCRYVKIKSKIRAQMAKLKGK